MARQTIKQRIALDGGKEIEAELKALGKVGEEAFKKLQQAANQAKGVPPSFIQSLKATQVALTSLSKSFVTAGRDIQQAGRTLFTHLTLPVVGLGVGVLKVAGDFEKAMNEFVANTGVAGAAFDSAKEKAIDLGNASVFSATQSIQAMTELAKVGLDYEQIMQGAAKATVDLAAANGAELAPAAAVVGDVINQFGMNVKDLGGIVNNVSGTLIQSKLDFDGYRLAIGQAGGTAGALGIKLEEFNAVLAATASSFASGSDAGTSFKTFLLRLTPQTVKATALFNKFNLQFFDAKGNFLGLAHAADELQKKLGNLSDEDRNIVFGELFGTDAIRTAIALMKQGGDGVTNMMKKLEATNGAELAAVRVKGFNGALDQLKSAFDQLAIAIGDSGVLQFATDLTLQLTEFLKELSKVSPETLRWGTAIAAVAAAIGPLLIGLGLLTTGLGLGIGAIGRFIGLLLIANTKVRALFALAAANPLIAAITLVGAGIAIWAASADTASAAMERHKGIVGEVEEAYRKAGLQVKNMADEIKNKLLTEALAEVPKTQAQLSKAIEKLKLDAGILQGLFNKPTFEPLVDDLRAGKISITDFIDGVAEIGATLGQNDPKIAAFAQKLIEVATPAGDLEKAVKSAADTIALLTGKMTDAEFQAQQMGGALDAIDDKNVGSGAAEGIKGVGDAATDAKGKIEELGKSIKVTSFGDSGKVEQFFDIAANGAATLRKDAEDAAGAVTGIGDAATGSGKKISAAISPFAVTVPVNSIIADVQRIAPAVQQAATATTDALNSIAPSVGGIGTATQTAANDANTALAGIGTAIAPDAVTAPVDAIVADVQRIVPAAQEAATGANAALGQIGKVDAIGAEQLASAIVAPFNLARGLIDGIINNIGSLVRGGFTSLLASVNSIAAQISAVISRILSALRAAAAAAARLRASAAASGRDESGGPGLARGGHLSVGAGTSTSDSIPAWLSLGEFVTRAKAVAYYGPELFHALNSMRLPKDFLKSIRGFSVGGMMDGMNRSVSMPRLAGGGMAAMAVAASVGSSGTPMHIHLPSGQTIVAVAQESPGSIAGKLGSFQSSQSVNSTGRGPGWRR